MTQLKIVGEAINITNTIDKTLKATAALSNIYGGEVFQAQKLAVALSGYSTEAIKAAIAQSTLNETQIKAILVEKGFKGQLLETTTAELAQITSTNTLSASQKGTTVSTLGLGTAFKGLGVKIKSATASMIAWMATNPVGWITAVISAIGAATYGVIKLHDALTVSLEEQKEKLQETKEAYEGVKNELQEVESELQNTQNKIEELENIPNLTWVEQEELDRLREVTKELELQKQLRQDAQLESAEDLYKENKATFDKEFKSSYGNTSVSDLKEQLSSGHIGTGQLDYGNITDVISALQYIREEKAKLTDESEIAEYDEFISDLADSIKSNGQEYLSSLSEYKQNILEIASIRDLTEDEQAFYEYISSMQKMIYEFYSPATWNSLEFDSIFNTEGIEKTKEELVSMYQSGELSSAEMLESFPKLNQAIKESEIIAGESSDAFKEVFNEIAALAKEQADVVNGFDGKLKLFDQLTSSTDSLDKFQSSVKSAADAYTTLLTGNYSSSELLDSIQAINKAASDMGESIDWESISTSGNPLQAIQDAIESVSKAYANSVLSGAGMDTDSRFTQMLANIAQESYKSEAALSSLNTQVDSLQSAYSSLTDIIQTYNETGYITFDQLQTLLEMEPQYVACLIDENGQLQLNQESMTALANQRLNDAESQAVQQAMTELGKVAFQEEQTAVEDNAQAFSDAVDDLSTYNDGLAETIATANVAASEICKLNDAINGAESDGATDDQIDAVLDNLNTKLKLIQNTRNNLKQNLNNFGKIVGKTSSDSSSNNNSSAETTKDFSEELNWVEKLINKVSSALDKLKDKVSNTYIGWSIRNRSLSKAMEKTNEAINVQQQAYEKYMQKAASVGLSQEYINKIQNGSLNIEDITDESLSDKIKEYETWYDKALDCSDAIEELRTQLSELAKQKFDNISAYFDGLMETTEKSISKLEIREKNTFKAPSVRVYNGLYDETQNLISYNTQKVQQLEEALDSAVNSGYIEAGSEAWREMYNEILDVRNATEEYKLELQDISKRRYEAIIKPIEQELAEQRQQMNIIEKMQDRLALQGYVAAKGLYERQIRDNESMLNTLKEEATLLQQNMQDALSKGMEVGSDDWIDMKSAIDENVISVMELENSIIELNNAIRDLEWGKFDRFQSSISRITGESDFMIDMYSKDDIYDEDGKLTDAGSAVIGLHAQNYFAYKEQARAYKDEVDKINKEIEADPTNTTLIDRKNDLIDAYQNATKAAYDEYEAVIELGKDGYQSQIDSIQELIDAKKKQLETDKSLYEYQKSIAEKTKDIAGIQKQLSALANDDSEENRAKIQQLKVSLEDAQKDLEETQYDKWYNDQTDMLDKLAEEYAALISEQTQNEQEVFQEMIEYVNANAQNIQDTISSTAQEWGYEFNHGIDSVLDSGISGITDIGQNIYEEIQRLYELNERMYRVSADLGDLGVTDYGLETTISDETTARNFIERLYNGLLGRQSDEDGLNFWMNKLMNGETVQDMLEGFLNSDEYMAMGKSASDIIVDFYEGLLGRSGAAEEYNYWMDKYKNGMSLSEIGTHGFLDSDEFLSRDQWMRMLDEQPKANEYYAQLKKQGLIPIADYIRRIPEEQLTEFEKFMKMKTDLNLLANNTRVPQNLGTPDYSKMQNVVNNANRSFGDTNIKNEITFSIDHVTDYNDFVTKMQKDGKFEKMIEDMTIGKLVGKSSLAKNNYKWT